MKNTVKIELILVVLLPIVISLLGGALIYSDFQEFLGFARQGSRLVGAFEVYLGCSLLMALISLTYKHLELSYYWLSTLILSLLYAIYIDRNTIHGLSMVRAFIPLIVLGIGLTLIVVKIFYNNRLAKFRTLLLGLCSAILLTIFYAYLFYSMKVQIDSSFWLSRFVDNLILFVFIGFGMSLADLIVRKIEAKRDASSVPPEMIFDEEDEEAAAFIAGLEDDDEHGL